MKTYIAVCNGSLNNNDVHSERYRAPQLTPMQDDFVREYSLSGISQTEAARRAGYTAPGQRAYELLQNPKVQHAIIALQRREIETEGGRVGFQTLVEVCQSPEAPASARVSAARTLLEASGDLKRGAVNGTKEDEKPLSEMSMAEIEAAIADTKAQIDRMKNVTPLGRTIEGEADE